MFFVPVALISFALSARRGRRGSDAQHRFGEASQPVSLPRAARANLLVRAAPVMAGPLSPDETRVGRLPPFEVAKAYAFDVAVGAMEKRMGQSARALLGRDKGEFIAGKLELQGGGQPTRQRFFQSRSAWNLGGALGGPRVNAQGARQSFRRTRRSPSRGCSWTPGGSWCAQLQRSPARSCLA